MNSAIVAAGTHCMTDTQSDNREGALLERLATENHAWFVHPDSVSGADKLESLLAILSRSELAQYRRFVFPEHAHLYLVSHALVRLTLSKYVAVDPENWKFLRTEHGRPEIDLEDTPPLRFNLSHTNGLAACIVTLESSCGIDAEHVRPRGNMLGVAERMFSHTEYRELKHCTQADFLDYFFTRWTLREAYVKARGIGIGFPTRKLRFEFTGDKAIQLSLDDNLEDNTAPWYFQVMKPTPEHIVSTAIGGERHSNKPLITHTLKL